MLGSQGEGRRPLAFGLRQAELAQLLAFAEQAKAQAPGRRGGASGRRALGFGPG